MAHDLVGFASLFRLREIRLELQTLRRRIKARHAKHLRDRGEGGNVPMLFTAAHDPRQCHVCISLDGQVSGVNQAIQLFGGRVQDGEPSTSQDQA